MGIFEIGGISIFLAFAAGTLSVASPCVLPLIPAYLGYLTGAAIDSPEPAAATTAASAASGGGAGVATVGGGPTLRTGSEPSPFLHAVAFVSGFSRQLAGKRADLEFPLAQRLADRPPLSEILTDTGNRLLRGQQIVQARERWGYKITEISRHLRMHRNTVAAIARRAKVPGRCGSTESR